MIIGSMRKAGGSKSCCKARSRKPTVTSFLSVTVILFGLLFLLGTIGCGGGGGGSSGSTSTNTVTTDSAKYLLPQVISVVPTSETASSRHLAASRTLRDKLRALARAATDPGTDYSQAETRRYVEEHALEQFDIIGQVLNALAQTHYSDPENINAGPYKAMVAWEEENEGRSVKQLEPWVIDSAEIEENGQTILRVRAWIEEEMEGQINLIKAEFKVYSPATKKADGSYADFGVWTMNVKFGATATDDFFVASASVGDNGEGVIKIHERFSENMGPGVGLPVEMKAILHRADTAGYGQVSHPDFEALFGPNADPNLTSIPIKTVKYAYNQNYLDIQVDNDAVQYKDRNSTVEMTHRYGVYNAGTGQDVMKTKSFGFPIRYTRGDGTSGFAYYGAWQGRHQLWGGSEGNASIPEGTTVYREDTPPDQTPEQYTVGPTFSGTLAKRTYVDADLNDIKDIPVEIWINEDYTLTYNAADGKWYHCPQLDWGTSPPSCAVTPIDFETEIGFEALVVGEKDTKKWVSINGWDQTNLTDVTFVYELANALNNYTAGFYKATVTEGPYGSQITVNDPREALNPADVPMLWVWISGSIYVAYTGTGWVEKELINFNEMTWTPEFDDTGDKTFILPENRELYINMQGANYVVYKTGGLTYVKLELQTAANPSNATTVVPDGTIFKDQWNPDGSSTYEFVKDSTSANYLMLVYASIGDNDKDANGNPNQGVAVGAVVTSHLWGLEAYVNGVASDAMYNWEYDSGGGWGSVTYLKNTDGTYKLLDDPMRFNAITATNGAGETKALSLQYDGWMMGLPHLYEELAKNDWLMTDKIANKIINLPEGTQVTDSSTGTVYLLKPLEVSQFLNAVSSGTAGLPDISQADSVDLSTVPDYVEHGMGDMPDATLKYSEGELVG